MAVNRAVINIDIFAIGRINQLVTVFHMARMFRKCLDQQELGHGQVHMLAFPAAHVTRRIKNQIPTLQHIIRPVRAHTACAHDFRTAQQCADTFNQQTLGKRLLDIIVFPHAKTGQLINLVIFRCQENDRHFGLLAQMGQKLQSVHARHLDIKHGKIRFFLGQGMQRLRTIRICQNLITLFFQGHGNRRQDITVVINKCDLTHLDLVIWTDTICGPKPNSVLRLYNLHSNVAKK